MVHRHMSMLLITHGNIESRYLLLSSNYTRFNLKCDYAMFQACSVDIFGLLLIMFC